MITDTVAEEALDKLSETRNRLLAEIRKAVVGQDEVIEELLISLLARGHCLLTGIPGLGKTLLVKTVANCLSLGFKRIQFTPDLMPADVLGSEVVDEDPGHGNYLSVLFLDPFSRRSFWPTKLIVHHPRHRQPCLKQWKKDKLQ